MSSILNVKKIIKTTAEQATVNCLYLNPNTKIRDSELILVDSIYLFYPVLSPEIPSGSVAMSKIQREFTNKIIGLSDISLETLNKSSCEIINVIKFAVEIINTFKVDIDSIKLKEAIRDVYLNYPFNISQKLYINYPDQQEVILVLNTTDLVTESNLSYGIFTDSTEISVLSGSANINIINNQSDNLLLDPKFSFEDLGIGGLKTEFEQMFRRAFVQRLFSPAVIKKMGIPHVRGIMLYGPPGTGKTLIARKLGSLLQARPPKIVNGPEILNKYIGQSEENIRNLFKDAEEEWKQVKENSQLHIIIFDEIDAICKKRGSSNSGVGDQVVNQLLSKIDGVESLGNILVIGMTNRLDLIDEALLRPGRFEIHLEISLPDEASRLEIFRIHTKQMMGNNYLDADIDFDSLGSLSKNYTGAEISAVVRSASSFALERKVKTEDNNKLVTDDNILVNMGDMIKALSEIKPAFGFNEKEFETFNRVFYKTDNLVSALDFGRIQILALKNTNLFNTNSIIFHGENGTGKTTVAVRMALLSNFPFVKIISPRHMVGMSENEKVNFIKDKFMDAYKSAESVIILDDIEGIIEYVSIGPRFSNSILQALKIFIKAEDKNKIYVIGTTSIFNVIEECGVSDCFSESFEITKINETDYKKLCEQNSEFSDVNFHEETTLKKLMAMLSRPDESTK